jgi:hypothetical protein
MLSICHLAYLEASILDMWLSFQFIRMMWTNNTTWQAKISTFHIHTFVNAFNTKINGKNLN